MLPLFVPNFTPQAPLQGPQQPLYKTTGFGWPTTQVAAPSQMHVTSYDIATHPAGLNHAPTIPGAPTQPLAPHSSDLANTSHHVAGGASQPQQLPSSGSHPSSAPHPTNNRSTYSHASNSYNMGVHPNRHASSGFSNDPVSSSYGQIITAQSSSSGSASAATSSTSHSGRASSGPLPRAEVPPSSGPAANTTEFIHYQSFSSAPSSTGQPLPTQHSSFYMSNTTSTGPNTSYQVLSSQPQSQPSISISVYDSDPVGVTSNSSRSAYVPAPGQAFVNMDKTTLFTPSNPPRPGSPRSPRTPKSPKSPKSPGSSAPHTPKSPRPD